MNAYQHPRALNPFKRFRQGQQILRRTSRASNPAWYQSALEMDVQVHIRTDGARIETFLYQRKHSDWSKGPAFEEANLNFEDKAFEFSDRCIELAREAGAKAVGIVLHFAEDFAIAELKPGLDLEGGDLAAVRDQIDREPRSFLADSSASIEENSWRILRYPGVESGAAIGISKRWAAFLDGLRANGAQRNFPVVTQTLSSPLVALLSLADFKRDAVQKPMTVILPYARFTVIAFLNAQGELLLLRSVQHRTQRASGALRQTIASTAASLELTDAEIHVLPTDSSAEQRVVEELGLVAEFGSRSSEVPGLFRYSLPVSSSGLPLPLECRVATTLDLVPGTPIGETRTFSTFRTGGWVVQDFLKASSEAVEVYPTRSEMMLLRVSRLVRTGLFLLGSACLIYFGRDIAKMVGQTEWSYREEDGLNLKQRGVMLNQQKARIDFWDNLLDDRSRAWAAMELLPRLAADPREMLIRSYSYDAAPINNPGQAKLGFTREWKIVGMARGKELEKLTRENVTAIFNQIASDTGATIYRMDQPTRSLAVNVKTQENTSYQRPAAAGQVQEADTAFPYLFDLTITQRFENTDPAALTTSKAP